MSEQNPHGTAREAVRQATTAVAETVQGVKDAAADAGAKTQALARQAGHQAGAAAQNLYGQGSGLVAGLDRTVAENPLAALLIAGAIGYGVAWMTTRRR
ncbi:MAG TPA: hypothetical protein VND87_09160 [Stellaceae bacterium]|nr:hypothetical protein [Stellaceae bacterium]